MVWFPDSCGSACPSPRFAEVLCSDHLRLGGLAGLPLRWERVGWLGATSPGCALRAFPPLFWGSSAQSGGCRQLTCLFAASLPSMRSTSPSCWQGRCSFRSGTTIVSAGTRSWGRWRSPWTPGTSTATWRSFCPCTARYLPQPSRVIPACEDGPERAEGCRRLGRAPEWLVPKEVFGETKTPGQIAALS